MKKRKYIVRITKFGENFGERFKDESEITTYAVSQEKAESNARYRTEGKAYWREIYGNDDQWFSYEYEARLA